MSNYCTIRHNKCDRIMVPKKSSALRCANCNIYRKSLLVMSTRADKERNCDASSKCGLSYHSKDELILRLGNSQTDCRQLKRRVQSLEACVKEMIELESI